MRLLIAEDQRDLAEALTVFFEKNHFSVDAVHNGFDAYEYASSGAYDAVILDVMMPKMDGWQVCREVRGYSKVPIIMLTARSDERDELQGFELGVDEYISKPFSPKILVARVEAILRRTNQVTDDETIGQMEVKGLSSEQALIEAFYAIKNH